MTQSTKWGNIKLETPATYRIRVQGHLDKSWSDQLSGMAITWETTAEKSSVTVIVGHLTDQAALSGVLNALYDLRFPLLSVENLDERIQGKAG